MSTDLRRGSRGWLHTLLMVVGLLAGIHVPDTAAGETLLADPPEGWQRVTHLHTGQTSLAEYVPPGQPGRWREKATFETFSQDRLPDPLELLEVIAAEQAHGCTQADDQAIFAGLENGYPTALRLLTCLNQRLTGADQLTMLKAIRGEQRFYVVTRALRAPGLATTDNAQQLRDTVARWSLTLRAVSVCDDSAPDHPCPTGP